MEKFYFIETSLVFYLWRPRRYVCSSHFFCLNGVLNGTTGLSVNILHKGDKLPVQRGFFHV